MAILHNHLKRLLRSRVSAVFTVVLVIFCCLFVSNYHHSLNNKGLTRQGNRVEGEGRSHRWSEFNSNLQGGFAESSEDGGAKIVGKWKKHVDKPGQEAQMCTVPVRTLETDTNKYQYHGMPPLNCAQSELFYLDRQDDSANILRLKHTVLAGRQLDKCQYFVIKWINDHNATFTTSISRTSQQGLAIVVKQDFFGVQCFLAKSESPEEFRNGGRLVAMSEKERDIVQEKEGQDVVVAHDLGLIDSVGFPDPTARSPHNKYKHGRHSKSRKPDKHRGQPGTSNTQPDMPCGQFNISHGQSDTQTLPEKLQNQYDIIEFQRKQQWGSGGWDDVNAPPPGDQEVKYNDCSFYKGVVADFQQVLVQIHPRDNVKSRSHRLQSQVLPHATQLNVLMFALDSMSHLGYQRKLPHTYQYLKETFGSVILNAYNIVGDGTTAAMLPILTGEYNVRK